MPSIPNNNIAYVHNLMVLLFRELYANTLYQQPF